MCSLTMFKTNVLSQAIARLGVIREGFASELRVWQRIYDTAEITGIGGVYFGQEQPEDITLTFIPSQAVIGKGIIIPPRSQLQTFMSITASFNFRLDMIIIEAVEAEDLAQFVI